MSDLTKAFRAHLVAPVLKLVDNKKDELVSCKEAIQLCKRLEKACMIHSDVETGRKCESRVTEAAR
jgi:hypothetical protein